MYSRFLLVKDNFYADPQLVLSVARNTDYHEPPHATGFRSREIYHEPGVKTKLEKMLGIKINRWDTDPADENGVFYQAFSEGKRREVPGVHSDEPYNDITVLIYLTPGLPFEYGTSMWMHKQTGLTDPATRADARRLKMKFSQLRDQLEKESKKRDRWVEIDRVGNRFNRMIAFPSGALHSATHHFGSDMQNGRIFQTFRIGVDWNTFKLTKA